MSRQGKIDFYDQRTRLRVLQILATLAVCLALVSLPKWRNGTPIYETLEMAGLACLLVCVFGRLWSILYSGARKNVELVTEGPYSITRNPLYLFSTIGAVGAGLTLGSLTLATLFGGLALAILMHTARGEASFLEHRFGNAYRRYAAAVPFFWPDPRRYRDTGSPTFSPKALRRTLVDALYFLAVIPAAELIEWLRAEGLLPHLLALI